jgi:hypothetical protein
VAFGPAEVHPQQHLGPVGGFGASGAGADREQRGALVVLAGEQQLRPLAQEVALEARIAVRQLGLELGVGGLVEQGNEGLELLGAAFELAPALDLGAQDVGPAEDLLGVVPVVPESGRAGQPFELCELRVLGREVKAAPRSTGSARPGLGRTRSPSTSDPEVLQQDRTELDQPGGRFAPGDDGVHAGTVAVVRADAAVAITVECVGVGTGSAITLASDQIDEGSFLSLLHKSLSTILVGTSDPGRE